MNYAKTAILLAGLTALFMGIGGAIGGQSGAIVAFIMAAIMNLFTYWNSSSMVLRTYQAQEITEKEAPDYYRIVQKLAQNAKLPMPKVYIIHNPQPNAFATGRSPNHAAVAATTGLLDMLTARELAGVMAHELAHVKNHDTLTMTIAATISGAISSIAQFALFFGGRNSDGERQNPFFVMLASLVAPFAAMILQMAISRSREYVADRMGSEISQDPEGLASALQKISGGVQHIPNYDAEQHPATAPLFIINPLTGKGMDNLFSTHPLTENRLKELYKLAQHMGHLRPLVEGGLDSRYDTAESEIQKKFSSPPEKGPWG